MKLALPLLLIGSSAWAECPTAADLAGGIRLRLTSGDVMVFMATQDPIVLTTRIERSYGGYYLSDRAWGLYAFRNYGSTAQEPESGISFRIPESQLPRPVAETRVTFLRVGYWGGPYPPEYRETYTMGPIGTVTLAGCAYRAFEVVLEQTGLLFSSDTPADDPARAPRIASGWAYLVDLGFAVESWYGPPEDRRLAPDVIAIEAVR